MNPENELQELRNGLALAFNTIQYATIGLGSSSRQHQVLHAMVTIECQADAICAIVDELAAMETN